MKLFGRKKESRVAPVLPPNKRDWGVEYRRPDDAENVIRINQRPPKGFPERLFEFAAVAGVSYREDDVRAFIMGTEQEISLRRVHVDEQHPSALAIWGLWVEGKERRSAQLGFVPREMNDAIGEKPVAATLVAMYAPTKDKGPGLRIDIWTTRSKK